MHACVRLDNMWILKFAGYFKGLQMWYLRWAKQVVWKSKWHEFDCWIKTLTRNIRNFWNNHTFNCRQTPDILTICLCFFTLTFHCSCFFNRSTFCASFWHDFMAHTDTCIRLNKIHQNWFHCMTTKTLLPFQVSLSLPNSLSSHTHPCPTCTKIPFLLLLDRDYCHLVNTYTIITYWKSVSNVSVCACGQEFIQWSKMHCNEIWNCTTSAGGDLQTFD